MHNIIDISKSAYFRHTVIYFVSSSQLVCVPQHMVSHTAYITAAVDIFHSLYPSHTTPSGVIDVRGFNFIMS